MLIRPSKHQTNRNAARRRVLCFVVLFPAEYSRIADGMVTAKTPTHRVARAIGPNKNNNSDDIPKISTVLIRI